MTWRTVKTKPAKALAVELFYGNLNYAGLVRLDFKVRDPRRAIGYFDGSHFKEAFTGHRVATDGDEDAVTHWRALPAAPVKRG